MDAGPSESLGYGQLGAYAIRSNTFASRLVHHVLGDKPGTVPHEGATGTVLESLRHSAVVAQLLALGPAPAPLAVIAKFMGQVAQIFADLLRQTPTSKCYCKMRALRLQRTGQLWHIELESSDGSGMHHSIYAEHVILALGAFQEAPRLNQRHHQTKVVCSNDVLSKGGLQMIRAKLGPKHGKVCVVGGAHSAFSVAWLCLRGESTQCEILNTTSAVSSIHNTHTAAKSPHRSLGCNTTAPVVTNLESTSVICVEQQIRDRTDQSSASSPPTDESLKSIGFAPNASDVTLAPLPPLEISCARTQLVAPSSLPCAAALPQAATIHLSLNILHRSPVRVFYVSKRDADADGYRDYKQTNRHGQVHAFAGLRGDAKNFFNDVIRGREPRVRLCQVKPGGSKSLITRCFDEAHVIVWAVGYKSHTLPILDEHGVQVCLRTAQGQIQVDQRGRILCGISDCMPNLYGNGHGYGLPATYENGELDGSKGRADGVAVYMKQGAAVILHEILGDRYSGPPPHISPDRPPPPKLVAANPEKQLAHVDRLCQPRPPVPSTPHHCAGCIASPVSKVTRGSKRPKHGKKVTPPRPCTLIDHPPNTFPAPEKVPLFNSIS